VVHFLGNMSEQKVADQLSKADFLILFSNYENQPCVILEAFSCGKPVIVTSVGGIPEIVTKERGVLVPKQDENGLQSAILEMLENHSTYSATEIREYAIEHFSHERIGESFAEFYATLLKHNAV
jgi:glycosyltransferase involved in cell wall biosynthesis